MLARDLRRQVPATKYVGTAVRLMFGGDIAVSARTVGDVAAAVTEMIELDWLPNGLWDYDLVVFGSLALRGVGVSIIHVSAAI